MQPHKDDDCSRLIEIASFGNTRRKESHINSISNANTYSISSGIAGRSLQHSGDKIDSQSSIMEIFMQRKSVAEDNAALR